MVYNQAILSTLSNFTLLKPTAKSETREHHPSADCINEHSYIYFTLLWSIIKVYLYLVSEVMASVHDPATNQSYFVIKFSAI